MYSEYLFAQLFHTIVLEEDNSDPYDILFPIVKNEYGKFIKSDFNIDTQGKYQCMVDYLNANADRIGITIADHVNI